MLNCCDAWNHSPISLSVDTTPIYHLTDQHVDLNVRFLFPFGQAVVVHRLKQEKKKRPFKFHTNNVFGYVLGFTSTPNRGVLEYLPKRKGNRIYRRKDVTAVNLGNELLYQADDSAPANAILTSDNKIVLPENIRLKAPGVRFLDLNNDDEVFKDNAPTLEPSLLSKPVDNYHSNEASDGDGAPDLISDDSFDEESESVNVSSSSSSIASRINQRKRSTTTAYTSDKYVLTSIERSRVLHSNVTQQESDDEPTLAEAMESNNWSGPLGWEQAIYEASEYGHGRRNLF